MRGVMDEINRPNASDVKYFVVLFIVLLALSFFLVSCTISTTLIHTEGQATDVVDETATNDVPISIPVTL